MERREGIDLVSIRLSIDGTAGYGKITSPDEAVKVMSDVIRDMDREYLCVINLLNDGTPVNASIVSIGDYNSSEAKPVMIVRPAVLSGASGIIVLHNHTSGDTRPSEQDRIVTQNIKKTCEIIGIRFVDHIIVGKECYYSFRSDRVVFQDGSRKAPEELYDHITFRQLIEKYFITPEREGYSYSDRMREGYQMLSMIAEDIDKTGDGSMNVKDYVEKMAREEGIIKNKIPLSMRMGASR